MVSLRMAFKPSSVLMSIISVFLITAVSVQSHCVPLDLGLVIPVPRNESIWYNIKQFVTESLTQIYNSNRVTGARTQVAIVTYGTGNTQYLAGFSEQSINETIAIINALCTTDSGPSYYASTALNSLLLNAFIHGSVRNHVPAVVLLIVHSQSNSHDNSNSDTYIRHNTALGIKTVIIADVSVSVHAFPRAYARYTLDFTRNMTQQLDASTTAICASSNALQRPQVMADCFGEITSPNYPRTYYNNHRSTWLLVAPHANTIIQLNFTYIVTESSDVIRAYDGYTTEYARLLGEMSGSYYYPPTHYSTWQYMYVTFTTDYSSAYMGFRAEYKAVFKSRCSVIAQPSVSTSMRSGSKCSHATTTEMASSIASTSHASVVENATGYEMSTAAMNYNDMWHCVNDQIVGSVHVIVLAIALVLSMTANMTLIGIHCLRSGQVPGRSPSQATKSAALSDGSGEQEATSHRNVGTADDNVYEHAVVQQPTEPSKSRIYESLKMNKSNNVKMNRAQNIYDNVQP